MWLERGGFVGIRVPWPPARRRFQERISLPPNGDARRGDLSGPDQRFDRLGRGNDLILVREICGHPEAVAPVNQEVFVQPVNSHAGTGENVADQLGFQLAVAGVHANVGDGAAAQGARDRGSAAGVILVGIASSRSHGRRN